MRVKRLFWLAVLAALTAGSVTASQAADDLPPADVEFFETRIRPVLVENCYECHNSSDAAEGSLAVDSREALAAGGDGGAVIVPGEPEESRLLAVLRHEIDGLEMPQGGPRLDDRVIADFAAWIAAGAGDPRDAPPDADALAEATSWESTLARRKSWWSFQPIERPNVPAAVRPGGSAHPIDRFLDAALAEQGLAAAPDAAPHVVIRRLCFQLTGLPPTPELLARWTPRLAAPDAESKASAVEALVDELLASEQFGERWARHWMDWIRYAESHGSEGDPAIVGAWRYRDYLIRALNDDVPFDQLVREHIAGDLLESPRVDESLGIVESAIGPAHWRMVFHGFAPTDALDERVRFTDDQINSFSKAFLGLTVSCARCHDHKFDAISQRDYYALFGVLASCRPGRAVIDTPARLDRGRDALTALKPRLRAALADDWLEASPRRRAAWSAAAGVGEDADEPSHVLHLPRRLRRRIEAGEEFELAWKAEFAAVSESSPASPSQAVGAESLAWDFSRPEDYAAWRRHGNGAPPSPQGPGEFAVAPEGESALIGVYPAGVYTHAYSAKNAARLTSTDFRVEEGDELWARALGDGASFRYVVQDFPRDGTVYPVSRLTPQWQWRRFNLSYWQGDDVHIEFAAAGDAPLLVKDQPRSWFGVREVRVVRHGETPPGESLEHLEALFVAARAAPPESVADLIELYVNTTDAAVAAWRDGAATDAQALLIDACLLQGLLSNSLADLPRAGGLVEAYRRQEKDVVAPIRVPSLDETVGRDQPLFLRGDHRRPADETPRRFLEAIDATPYQTAESGRRELAEDLLRDDNPLTRRVIVNRLWHHLFGRGLVATPDNFGRMGELPSHPRLLDWLAVKLVDEGWSLKRMIRLMVTSRAWRRSSLADADMRRIDPENKFLARAPVRRLEAEAIRDAVLHVSGRLDPSLFGPPVGGDAPRRSVYVRVIRNSLDPFLRAFDFPEPFAAIGRRPATNVPAQSLAMMNDESVARSAAVWARRLLENTALTSDSVRIERMFLSALGRPPTGDELTAANSYLTETAEEFRRRRRRAEELQRELADAEAAVREMLDPVRERLQAGRRPTHADDAPTPIARWEFEDDDADAPRLTRHAGATVADGALVVDGRGYAVTEPLAEAIGEKTLEAWVQLDDLDQRGGGVMSLQTPGGEVFDAIVFGEQEPRRWLAGSNFFARTESFQGEPEAVADQQPVHVAIAYHADGRVAAYREGRPYGAPYASDGPHRFAAGEAVVAFGLRHAPAGGDRLLSGRILVARLYDRALDENEVAASARSAPLIVTESQVIEELANDQRLHVEALRRASSAAADELASLAPVDAGDEQVAAWTELARAMLLLQEFLYVR